GQSLDQGERLEPSRRQPFVRRLRHPAGAARRQDARGGQGLAAQPEDADPLGPRLHQGEVRQAVRRLGALPVTQLVLTRGAEGARAHRVPSLLAGCTAIAWMSISTPNSNSSSWSHEPSSSDSALTSGNSSGSTSAASIAGRPTGA